MEIGYREPCPRRVRVVHDGRVGVDTTQALYVWEMPYYPWWYVPTASIDQSVIPAEAVSAGVGIDGYSRVDWNRVDSWFEEDEEVFKHPRDPYHRVDVLHSSRHIVVRIGGVIVAESTRPRLVFETNLPTRYYLPALDVRMDLLTPTSTSSVCPYKGTARYWTATIEGTGYHDVAWGYDNPVPEAAKLAGLICFYNERVDITVDGVPEARPVSPFS